MGKYDDIIDLPHHRSSTHPHMPLLDRAAQFSPFAALSGHEEAISETGRITESKHILTPEKREELDEKLQMIRSCLTYHPEVSISYFLRDTKKSGGSYLSVIGILKKIDENSRSLILENGTSIPLDDIYDFDSPMLNLL
ncbi:MAG: hypothetical protein K2O59_01720 [Lachnospiraceae bacterium]|nr:hypothetical protein [Lachnospiraceae bacterium]MDE7176509.1 hypothetical protein [Lachnospiraceae bacterium]